MSLRIGIPQIGMRAAGGLVIPLPLDSLDTAAAYSIRKLRTAYVEAAIRVRRSSDSAEQDIGFVAGELDTTALLTFIGADDGFVTTLYDQSGNAGNAMQAIAAYQPRIVNAGVLDTLNGLPTVILNLANLVGPLVSTPDVSIITVTSNVGISAIEGARPFGVNATVPGIKQSFLQALDGSLRYDGAFDAGAALPVGPLVRTATRTTTQVNDWRNGNAGISAASSLPNVVGNIAFNPRVISMGKISEAILFTNIISTTDRQNLERNQGAYYGITVA